MREVKGYMVLNKDRDDYDFGDYELDKTYYDPEGFIFFYSAKGLTEDIKLYEHDVNRPYKYSDAIVDIDNRKDGELHTIHKWYLDEYLSWLEITEPK